MSAFLRALSRRIRLALHRHDPMECWCEVTADDAPAVRTGCVYCMQWQDQPHDGWCPRALALPVNPGPGACPTCFAFPSKTHELSCPEVSYEQFRAFLDGRR